jgi:hypothetical protein
MALVGSAAREIARALALTDAAEGLGLGSAEQLRLLAEARMQENAARSNLLSAYSLAALEAKARGVIAKPYDPTEAEEQARAGAAEKLARIKRPRVVETTAEEA